jgi:hypothetical protein
VSTRELVRRGVAEYFGGPLDMTDPAALVYRSGPLQVNGLATTRAYWEKRIETADYLYGLDPARGMGAVVWVQLGQVSETRRALGGETSGWRERVYAVVLHVYHYGTSPRPEVAQGDVDQLIDAIIDLIHADRTLGGTVMEAGESRRGIVSSADLPVYTEPERSFIRASVSFDATVYVQA